MNCMNEHDSSSSNKKPNVALNPDAKGPLHDTASGHWIYFLYAALDRGLTFELSKANIQD